MELHCSDYNFGKLEGNQSNNWMTPYQSGKSFDENFYVRVPSDITNQAKVQENPPKFQAQDEILKNILLTDYNHYLDTLTVSQELVQDSEHFFELFALASDQQAFTSPLEFKFDQ
mmetsp:Transcript_28971/g.27916  ORF Transcript_28971/g.27916 Transcript_28971/m.27916 type:complete len:115 (-) Transcript_28971:2301-2645(-)